ncbi:tyrosine recombinase [Bacteroidia bacterium]|nr:tyrosine recombinase [Bacteroidia bacterium]
MNVDLKVSFYLKRERKSEKPDSSIYPVVGKIITGKSIAQFSSKLKVDERLWNVKSGRAIGKSHAATELNREINKINLSIHSHCKEILTRTGKVTALEVKNAFQGIASTQKTLLVLFKEMMREFHSRVGIDRSQSTYREYEKAFKHLQRFIREKYKVQDIPLNQLNLPFIESFGFHLRIERGMKAGSANISIILLQKAVRIALHRNLVACPPFYGYKPEKPEIQVRSLSKDELERLLSTPIQSPCLCLVRYLFVFASFTGISYIDLKNLTWKEILAGEDGSLWISKTRQKTGVPFLVKLMAIPMQVMEKYRGLAADDFVFRVPEQNGINHALKKVAKKCGIDKTLSFHMSRHMIFSFRLKTSKLQE